MGQNIMRVVVLSVSFGNIVFVPGICSFQPPGRAILRLDYWKIKYIIVVYIIILVT